MFFLPFQSQKALKEQLADKKAKMTASIFSVMRLSLPRIENGDTRRLEIDDVPCDNGEAGFHRCCRDKSVPI